MGNRTEPPTDLDEEGDENIFRQRRARAIRIRDPNPIVRETPPVSSILYHDGGGNEDSQLRHVISEYEHEYLPNMYKMHQA
jgi:hypothetical protein